MVVAGILLPPFIIYLQLIETISHITYYNQILLLERLTKSKRQIIRLLLCKGRVGFGAAREPFEELNLKISNPLSMASPYLKTHSNS